MVVRKSALNNVRHALEEMSEVGIKLEFVTIPDNDEYGTADTLRHIKDKIKVSWSRVSLRFRDV